MKELLISDVKKHIFTIRGTQVMLDKNLAFLYGVETRVLKQAVNRNIKRFPKDFMFELTTEEINSLVSQSVIPSKKHLGGAKPYVFTEQGVSNLATVLSSAKAIKINIQIIRAFVSMRKFISTNTQLFQRLDRVELKQIEYDAHLEKVFKALEISHKDKGIFFEGQVFDAYKFISELIRSAEKEILLIDNYVDESTLTLFTKRRRGVRVKIYTRKISEQLLLDVKKFNSQYETINLQEFTHSHDRFMIVDSKHVYHFGASLKDLGNKWFAFSKFDTETVELLARLN